jgi:isopentenyl-diphosphate delta-isomerase
MEYVILVDEHDREVGTAEKLSAHQAGGRLHRAFSIFISNAAGELLLQRRAATKYHFGGLWTNTCCGHPRPGEELLVAAQRRLQEEMGFALPLRRTVGFVYRATDPQSELTEYEFDHVLVGLGNVEPRPDPAEVEAYRWLAAADMAHELAERPEGFTPWFGLALFHLVRGGWLWP